MHPEQIHAEPSAVSLHEQVRRDLLRRITNGEFTAGDMLPSEEALCRQYRVSRITVRRAVTDLAAEFYVSRKRGVGTVVTSRHGDRRIFRLTGFFGDGLHLDVRRLMEETIPADATVAKALKIEPGTQVQHVRSVAHRDGEPFTLTEAYVVDPGDGSADELNTPAAMVRQRIERAEQQLDAVIASPLVAEHLGLEAGQPIMRARRVFLAGGEVPQRYTESCYHPDRYRFMADLRPRSNRVVARAPGLQRRVE